MILSGGEMSIFWSNGLVASICAMAIYVLFWPQISAGIARLAGTRTERRDGVD